MSGLVSLVLLLAGFTAVIPPTAADAVQYPQSLVVSDRPVAWAPSILDGWVTALAQVGTKMIAGGSFTSVQAAGSSTSLARTDLFAFDAATGAIDPNFHPTLDDAVNVVEPSPDGLSVIVGGEFHTVNGQARNGLVALSLATGNIVPGFAATVTGGPILDMVVRGNTLYLGGRFTSVNGVSRPYLAAVDATTGALSGRLVPVLAGMLNGGTTYVDALDVSPDGSRLVVIGNFTTIDGQDRVQMAQFDLTSTPNTLANWETDRLKPRCAARFNTYVEDVDYSPDGSYFVLVTTGAFMGGVNTGVLCDTSSRWETNAVGSALQPTWIDYAGGDTQTSVAVTSVAVYVAGHMRWENSPYAGDQPGPGAVARQGLAALDPVNGLPLPWNPSKAIDNGTVRSALLGTSQGLWLGTDVTLVAGETHQRLAFFPLNSGTVVPPADPGTLPGTLFSLPSKTCPSADPSILYRVNAGGPALSSLDCGPNWAGDTAAQPSPLHNSGSNTATWNPVGSVDSTVPATTPAAVFQSERWSPSDSPAMTWTFPVAAGTHVAVRLYFANQYSGTSQTGKRVFDVSINGQWVLTNYDIVAAVGNQVGTARTFNVTSSGAITVTTRHKVDNPLFNAIEIVNLDATPVPPPPQNYLVSRTFSGTSAGSPTNLSTPTIDWSQARGAFMLGGTLYLGWQDGNLYSRPFDGITLGPATLLNPYVIGNGPVFSDVSGAFYANGRIYYTVKGDPIMHTRFFQPQTGIVGAVQSNVASNGFDWSQAAGLTMATGKLYWATPDGNLHSAVFSGGAAQPGTDSIVSGPGAGDGQQWGGNGMFVLSTAGPGDTQAPTAPTNLNTTSVTATQVDLAWTASSDNTGVTSYEVYRNGSLLTTVAGSQTTYSDTSVAPGTFYTYGVFARDAAGNLSGVSNQVNATTPSLTIVFSDGFESGNLSSWTSSTGMTVQSTNVFAGTYAASATANSAKAYASKTLATTYAALNYGAAFKIVSQGSNAVNLLRFQTGSGANILTLFVSTSGNLMLRNELAGANVYSSTVIPPGSWHQVQVRLTINGPSSTVQALLDGSPVNGLTQTLDLGTNPIGRLILGDNNAGRTFQAAFDEVVAVRADSDTQAPTAPTNLNTTSVTATQVGLAWTASSDDTGVTSYEVYRDGSLLNTVAGSQTTYSDTSVSANTPYAYTVFAKDAVGNTSSASNQVNVTTPPASSLVFSDGFESGNLSSWTSSTGMTVQSTNVFAGTYAASATANSAKAYASKTLATTYAALNYGAAFKIVSQGSNAVNLLRFQTGAGANILTLFVSTSGNLMLRNELAGANVYSSTVIPPGSWHQVQVRLTISGPSSTVQVLLDGSPVNGLTQTLDLGTNPIGRLILGDNNAGRTFQAAFDEVVAGQ